MARAFVSIGSNIDPEENLIKAIRLLKAEAQVRAISTVYLTEPVGGKGQPSYYNCMVEIESALPPLELKCEVLRRIEDKLGRVREEDRFAPRAIDLDLVLYDNVVLKNAELVLPDPEIRSRPFLAGPLFELAPDLIMPDSKEPIAAIASRVRGGDMTPLTAYTERLKKEMAS
jgi:2-amino-4-hydroxy-6-hydroxymethyldihydropteridine diphosphokinase